MAGFLFSPCSDAELYSLLPITMTARQRYYRRLSGHFAFRWHAYGLARIYDLAVLRILGFGLAVPLRPRVY